MCILQNIRTTIGVDSVEPLLDWIEEDTAKGFSLSSQKNTANLLHVTKAKICGIFFLHLIHLFSFSSNAFKNQLTLQFFF